MTASGRGRPDNMLAPALESFRSAESHLVRVIRGQGGDPSERRRQLHADTGREVAD